MASDGGTRVDFPPRFTLQQCCHLSVRIRDPIYISVNSLVYYFTAMASQSRPEPMNASPHHSKVKVTLTLSDPVYVAGAHISGKMEVESRADLDSLLGIGVMMVELYAIQGRGSSLRLTAPQY